MCHVCDACMYIIDYVAALSLPPFLPPFLPPCPLQVGDMIKVTKQNENGMWEGELNGKKGHFPFKLVEVVDSNNHR